MLKPKYAAILASVWIFAPLMLMSGIGHSQQEKKGLSKRAIPDSSKQRPKLDLELLEKSAEKYSDESNHVSALLLRQQIVTVLEKSTDRRTQIALATALTQAAHSQPKYAHPYYWAPFILMGNWK